MDKVHTVRVNGFWGKRKRGGGREWKIKEEEKRK
jgi:hypothetical protein